MRILFFTIFLVGITRYTYSQNLLSEGDKKNEIRINTLYAPGGYLELSYERALGHKSAIGVAAGTLLGSAGSNYVTDILTFDTGIIPYYRYYFGRKQQAGFFLEGNTILHIAPSDWDGTKETNFGFGIGFGTKFILQDSWSVDFVIGGGFILNQDPKISGEYSFFSGLANLYPRLGITIGKRF